VNIEKDDFFQVKRRF